MDAGGCRLAELRPIDLDLVTFRESCDGFLFIYKHSNQKEYSHEFVSESQQRRWLSYMFAKTRLHVGRVIGGHCDHIGIDGTTAARRSIGS